MLNEELLYIENSDFFFYVCVCGGRGGGGGGGVGIYLHNCFVKISLNSSGQIQACVYSDE